MHIDFYKYTHKSQWDTFIKESKNATFLLQRDYMEYHQERFIDSSLIIYDDKNNIIALLPANRVNNVMISHQGLTYGGLIYNATMTQPQIIKIFNILVQFLQKRNVAKLIYKTIPRIYHRGPSDEDQYALFLLNATLHRRDSLTVIDRAHPIQFQTRRVRAVRKSKKRSLIVKQRDSFEQYWHILEDNLHAKHGAIPVHSFHEMTLLHSKFPNNIKLFECYEDESLLAGIVVYETDQVAHFQYIAASEYGKSIDALDFLFNALINDIYATKPYIDFGISNENEGRHLNQGLIEFKEGFGGRSIAHDFYTLDLSSNFSLLS